MGHKKSFGLPCAILLLASLGASLSGSALTPVYHPTDEDLSAGTTASRLAGDWRSSRMVRVPASKPPLMPFQPQSGIGLTTAPANGQLQRMLLLLAPSPARQIALTAALKDLQDPASPHYHQWLTPTAFADHYANSIADVTALSDWLQMQGFQVASLPIGRGWIEFSGTVAQVEQAFHTQVNSVAFAGGSRFVLGEEISIPAAFAPVVEGLVSLDGAVSAPDLTAPQTLNLSASDLAAQKSLDHAAALTPQLTAQLLHIDELRASGIGGAGEAIAIASRSNVNSADVAAFRTAFGLPASAVKVLLDGIDPGLTSDQAEATLSVSWAGAAAPEAQIILVPVAATDATDGLDLSLAAIVDQVLAHTVAVGYSICEAALAPAHQAFYAALYRQAAAEGISVIASSGDSGPSACHAAGTMAPVNSGYGVNALASTAWNTAVGAAAFAVSGGAADASTLSAWSPAVTGDPAYAGGGGSSMLYAAVWQPIPSQPMPGAGAPGVHNRLLPDLALPTAVDSGASPGLAFCLGGVAPSAGCTLVRAGGSAGAAAIFAGIGALVEQQNGPQGNLAPHLYALSSQSGIFTDVERGSAQLPCVQGSPGCGPDGQIGFAAAAGFDLATGLGVVNAHGLVTEWGRPEATGSGLANVTNTTAPSQTINPSGSIVLSANVVSGTGGPAPTGTVTFVDITLSRNVATVALDIGTGETSTATVTVTGALAQGGHQIVASYSGDTNYAAGSSQPVVVEVQPSSTTTTIVPSTLTPVGGATFTVNATITSLDAGTGALPPSGTVDFRLDGVSQGTKPVATGTPSTATINMTAPFTGGAHQIAGFYSGDGNYYNSTSQAVTITVAKITPTIAVTPSTTTPSAGSPLQISASISPPNAGEAPPTGTVTFTLDGTSVGTQTVTSGSPSTATIIVTAPGVGAHTVGAIYNGDTNYTTVTSSPVTITVAKTPTTLAITPGTTTPPSGSSLLVTATLSITGASSATATGTVTFTQDGSTVGTQTLASGTTAAITFTVPTSGSHTLQASYSGDANFLSSTSPSVNITVAKTPTTTVATPATTTPIAGSSLQVSATVTASANGSTQPSGTVTFTLDGVSAGVAPVVAGSPSTASITIATILAGTHTLVATYSGDTYYAASTSASVIITVAKNPSAITITPATLTPTGGGSLLVAASITSSNPAATNPSGTVIFLMDGVSQGTGTVTAGSPSTASFTILTVPAGNHVLTAVYSGDTAYAGSTSAPVAITASKGATVTTVTAMPPVLAPGAAETLTATVAPVNAVTGTVYSITGTVTFYDNGVTLLGTAAIASNVATLPGVALANNVSHSITALYSGDSNWLASASAALPLAATTLPVNVVLTSNLGTVPPGQALVLTVTVTPSAPPPLSVEQNPTGNVIFYDGTIIIGTVALTPSSLGNASTATLTTLTLPGGQIVLSAFYVGDLYYDAGTSNFLTLNVEAFTITPSPSNPPTNLNIVQGSSGSAAFVITGLGGFNNMIQVVCAVPSQDNMTCTATPQQLSPPGTVTFVVQTFTPGEQADPVTTSASNRKPPIWQRAAGGATLALLGFFLLPFGRSARIFTRRSSRSLWILLLLLAGLGSAGIGCSSVASVNSTGTPLGVAILKITASSYVDNTVVSQSVYLTVNVLAPGSTP